MEHGRIDPKADSAVSKACRHAVFVVFEGDEAGRGDLFAVFDKTVKATADVHQVQTLFLQALPERVRFKLRVLLLLPHRLAFLFQPVIERFKRVKSRCFMPQCIPTILHRFFHLTFFPTGCRITEISFKQIMTGHRLEAFVHHPFFATTNFIDSRFHVVVNTALRNSTKHPEGLRVRIKQHFVGLRPVGPLVTDFTVTELKVRDLYFHLLATNGHPVLAPVKLKRFTWREL